MYPPSPESKVLTPPRRCLGAMFRIAVQLCVTFAPVVVGIFLASILYSPTQLRTPALPGAHRIHPLESADTRPHLPNTGAIHLDRRYGSSMLARKGACSALRRCEAHSAIAERIALSGGITPCS